MAGTRLTNELRHRRSGRRGAATLALAALCVAGACGGGDGSSEESTAEVFGTAAPPSGDGPPATAPSTTAAVATTTSAGSEGSGADLPVIARYELDDRASDVWGFGESVPTVTRGIVLDGQWIGMLAVADGGPAATSGFWQAFVDDHHQGIPVISAPPAATAGGSTQTAIDVMTTWQVLSDELVLVAYDGALGAWTGAWHHDGRVWLVSGPEASQQYAVELIAQQARTGDEPEPEQFDVDVLEGPLSDVLVDVPGFLYIDPPHEMVVSQFASFSDSYCFDHFTMHGIHPEADPNPPEILDDADVFVTLELYSSLEPCSDGSGLVENAVTSLGWNAVQVGDLPGARTAGALMFSGNGIVVDAGGTDAALDAAWPYFEALAAAIG